MDGQQPQSLHQALPHQILVQPMQQVLPGPGILGYGILGALPTASGGADISCPVCGKTFANRSKLVNRHLNRPKAKDCVKLITPQWVASAGLFVCHRACRSASGGLAFFVTQKMLDLHNLEQHGIPIPDRPAGTAAATTNVQLFEGPDTDLEDIQQPHPTQPAGHMRATPGALPQHPAAAAAGHQLGQLPSSDGGHQMLPGHLLQQRAAPEDGNNAGWVPGLKEVVKEAVREELAPIRQELATIRAGLTQVLLLLNTRPPEAPARAARAGSQAGSAAKKRKTANT